MRRRCIAVALGASVMGLAACGRKGPPLPPLRPTPGPVTAVSARRRGAGVEIHFAIPSVNTDRTSPASVARVEIYARSVPADSPRPVQDQIALKENLVGVIEVKPPVKLDVKPDGQTTASDANAPAVNDRRPAAGEAVTFHETLPTASPTPLPPLKGRAALAAAAASQRGRAPAAAGPPGQGVIPARSPEGKPGTATTAAPAAAGAAAGAATEGGKPAAPPAPPKPVPPTRYFWIQAVSTHGKVGPAGDLVAVSLAAPPPPPSNPTIAYDEKTLTFSWTPASAGQTFRVYEVDQDGNDKNDKNDKNERNEKDEKNNDGRSLNDAPLKTPEFQAPVEFDHERCLAVSAVDLTGTAAVESTPVMRCATPKDTFPPAPPANLNGLPDAGSIALRWDPVTASDLAGYLVLRGEGTGGTLQQLTAAPLAAATYVDSTVRSGVTYVYVVLAVDTATNRSAQSNPYTVTVR